MSIRDKLLRACERFDLIAPGDRVLLGVSGGQDSVTLTLLLAELAGELAIELVVGHLHHGLRGSVADADQQAVAALAERLGLEFVTERTDVAAVAAQEHCGLEEAGRLARYEFFARAAAEHRCPKIALGHTATDRAETLLMNLFRGSGVYGLRSIPPRRDHLIRPLILISREETAQYCRQAGIRVCEDACNSDPQYRRNRVRADLLPHLEREYGPGVEAALCRAADALWEEVEWTEPLVEAALAEAEATSGPGLSLPALRALTPGLRQRVLRAFLQRAGLPLRDLSRERWEALGTLIEQGHTGQIVELGLGRGVQLEYDSLYLIVPAAPPGAEGPSYALPAPGRVELPEGLIVTAELSLQRPPLPESTATQAVLDAARTGSELVVRTPRPGDRFNPSGMSGRKKLQDFFVDNKVPRRARHPLLVTRSDGEILWVVGHRLAETARIGEATETYLILSVRA